LYEPFANGEVKMVKEDDQFITDATIIMPTAHNTHINVFWTETRYSYSNIPFPVFFSRVTSNVVMDGKWLDASRATNPTVLNERITAAHEQLSVTKWQDTVAEIHRQLSRINRVYNPADHYNEQARRLLIDAVLLPVTDFAKRTLSVETTLFEESTNQASIGWGPLDYVLYGEINDFVLTECVDPLPDLPAGSKRTAGDALLHSGPKSSTNTEFVTKMSADEKNDEEEDEGAMSATVAKVGNKTLEAKQRIYMNAFGCVQTGGQMLDNHMLALSTRNCTVGSTVGCLSSGHEWVYFLLDTHTAGELPRFTLLGERSVSVFRATWDRAPPLKKGERRPSMKKSTDFDVDLEQVTGVALAAYVALTGQLLATPFE
jgi:hypothetical protein